MKEIHEEPRSNEDDLAWIFLAECPLAGNRLDVLQELGTNLLVQALLDLGIPTRSMFEILKALGAFLQEMVVRRENPGTQLPVLLRLYCQKRAKDDTSRGGWGYFLVERSVDSLANLADCYQTLVELYLYQEGD